MEEEKLLSLPSSSLYNAHPHMSLGTNSWLVAEESALGILSTVQPTMVSENRRNEVIEHIQSLIREYFGTEVLPYGSAPLKTYLPDGDIDLTFLFHQNTEEDWAREICNLLECEQQKDTEFVIKNVEYIHAQVRLVKCSVQDIAVDISFNQIAGLGALCFLEQVDQLVGKDHLFKRSIILVKAWCFYESRLLGAIYGLISTYALDILVLHILNLFHSSINGPLSVLYKFLNYYSTFDWDNYCVSLNGPVAISSLPEIVVESPQNDESDLLLGQFLKNDVHMFLLSRLGCETSEQAFPVKHLNIIDPLKDNNNLGRSVNCANFHRIKSAFSYGAKKLEEIMILPQESIAEGLTKFFVNTLNRNGKGQRPDVRVPVPVFGTEEPEVFDLSGDCNCYFVNLAYGRHYHHQRSAIQSSPPTSPPQVWNTSPILQSDQDFFYLGDMNGFVPIPFCLPIAAQPSSILSGDEEIMVSRGTGAYIPTLRIEENLKLLGTGTCIPDVGFQRKLMAQGTHRRILGMDFEKVVKAGGAVTFITDNVVEEKYNPENTATYVPYLGVEENANSPGTGIYNHDMGVEEEAKSGGGTHSSYSSKDPYNLLHIWGRGGDYGQTTQGLMLKSSPKNKHLGFSTEIYGESSSYLDLSSKEFPFLPSMGRDSGKTTREGLMLKSSLKNEQLDRVSSEMEKEGSRCIDLSLEEFPFLPNAKKAIPSKTAQPTVDSPQAKKSSRILESIEFGFFEPSVSPCKNPGFGSPPESSEHRVVAQSYKLEDGEDFPPLSSCQRKEF